ncbi:MAG: PIN domain-containing protein [Caldilineae bacterium]|nr:MAG: PIN domain-containing protein [Caldilineae bacterium]
MTNVVFVDTGAWYALANKKDINHERAVQFVLEPKRLLTTNYIIDEAITLTLFRAGYSAALRMGEQLWGGELADIVWVTRADEQRAWKLFKQYRDKMFSFTDCTSFAVMSRLNLVYAFTFDADFSQTGQFQTVP